MLGHQVCKRVAAAVAAPALARFMAGFAPAFLDYVFGVATRTAGDGWIDWR
jgi:hypothetical protein